MTRHSWPRRVALASLAAGLLLGTPASAGPSASAATREPYSIDLYRPGDFVSQKTTVQCIGASIQMMANVGNRDDRSSVTQLRYMRMARRLSPPRPPGWGKRRGASVHGWAAALRRLEIGPYTVLGYETMQEALRAAARSLRESGQPVGLLVWGGRHAWVMTGFQATADPLTSARARITHVDVLDPFYPRAPTSFGRSPRPGERLTVAELSRYFVRRQSTWSGPLASRWVIVATTDIEPQPRML